MLVALVARDVLWLRATMVAAQAVLGSYAWFMNVPAITLWNALFVAINTVRVVKILHERRAVRLPAEIAALYERHFNAFTPAEFLRWWQAGRRERLHATQLTWNGARPGALFFLLGGRARVSRSGESVTDLAPGQFVAEMSLITGEPANADVMTTGDADVIWWPVSDLREMQASQRSGRVCSRPSAVISSTRSGGAKRGPPEPGRLSLLPARVHNETGAVRP